MKIATIDELNLELYNPKLTRHLTAIKEWNPDKSTARMFKINFIQAEELAIKYRENRVLSTLINYTRYYKPTNNEEIDAEDINELLDYENRVIVSDHNGECLLNWDIDEWGDSTNELYSLRKIDEIYEVLNDKEYREHMMSKRD